LEYAALLGVRHQQISLWEKQKQQPTLETLVRLWLILKAKIPGINLQDLIEYEELESSQDQGTFFKDLDKA
jgi:transcriptional regulator with XRE-family HTH domain